MNTGSNKKLKSKDCVLKAPIEVRKLACDCGDWLLRGVGDSSVVRVSDSWLKGPGFESLQERRENFLPQGLFFRYTFHSRVARKKGPGHLPEAQVAGQVTPKYACTWRMRFCLKWHGAYGVRRTPWDGSSFMWHQPCQRCEYTTTLPERFSHHQNDSALKGTAMRAVFISVLGAKSQDIVNK